MALFGCRSCETYRQVLTALLAQLSDKEEVTLKLVDSHAKERAQLVDRLLASAQPSALRELSRASNPPEERAPGPPPRPNFPGLRRDHRPPPLTPLKPGVGSGEPASARIQEVVSK